MKRSLRRVFFGTIICTLMPLGAYCGLFRYFSVSTTSGKIQNTSEWQIPLVGIPYWRSSTIEETPLSHVIAQGQLASSADKWVFGAGSGNGTICAIGEGRHLFDAVNSEEVARFVELVARYRDRSEAQRWVRLLLDPARSFQTRNVIHMFDLPREEFVDKQHFEQWWKDHQQFLEMLPPGSADPSSPPG